MVREDHDKIKVLVNSIVNSENLIVPIPRKFNNSQLDVIFFIRKYSEIFSIYGITAYAPACRYRGKVIFFAEL